MSAPQVDDAPTSPDRGHSVPFVSPTRSRDADRLSPIADAMRHLAASALRGNASVLFSEAEIQFGNVIHAHRATVLLRSGGTWQAWHALAGHSERDGTTGLIPPDAVGWNGIRPLESGLFVPVRTGAVAALIELDAPSPADLAALGALAAALDLALTTCERQSVAVENLNEAQVLHRVASRILKSHDLEEILLLITQETKDLLAADICGILLREGEQIVMRRCVGNLSADTAALRMRQGQGLAGRVFATGEPYCVDDYVQSTGISRDFFGLAQVEKVRSALGAPLISKDDVIGVLEVWRRRPSTFTELDTNRMIVLANLTSIAIENAGLYAGQESMVRKLADMNRALVDRYEIIRSLAHMQQDLAQLLIDGRNLTAIAARASEHLTADVLIVDPDVRVLGACPRVDVLPPNLRDALQAALRQPPALGDGAGQLVIATGTLRTQKIRIGNEQIGLVAAISSRDLDEGAALAISQVAMAAALFHVEQRAASTARAETLEALLWDLLEGADPVRHAALDRARQMRVEIKGAQRVFLCSLTGVEDLAKSQGWGAQEAEACKRLVRQICEQAQDAAPALRLVGMRGNHVAFLLPDEGAEASERVAHAVAQSISRRVPGLSVHIGASGPQPDALALAKSFGEAKTAVGVAKQHGNVGGAVFERGGVIGVLLGLRQDADMRGLVRNTFGGLLDLSEHQRQTLLKTLKVFFDCGCSQQATARRLRVHHKTVRYRLARIGELTGLDLTTREDRLLVDLALYADELTGTTRKPVGNRSTGVNDDEEASVAPQRPGSKESG